MNKSARFLLFATFAILSACDSVPKYDEDAKRSEAERDFEASSALYQRQANWWRDNGSKELAALNLYNAGKALARQPGAESRAVTLFRQSISSHSRSYLSLVGANAQAIAAVYATSDKVQSAAWLQALLDVCTTQIIQGPEVYGPWCSEALKAGAKIASEIGEARLSFLLQRRGLEDSTYSRSEVFYKTVIGYAIAKGLTSEAEELRRNMLAVGQVEGFNSGPSLAFNSTAEHHEAAIRKVAAQAERYTNDGLTWLGDIRSAEVDSIRRSLGYKAEAEEATARLERLRSDRRERQSQQLISVLAAISSARGPQSLSPPPSPTSLGTSAPTIALNQRQTAITHPDQTATAPNREIWDTDDHSTCAEVLRIASPPTSNMQRYGFRNACSYAIKIYIDDSAVTGAFGSLMELTPGHSQESWWLLSTRLSVDRRVCRSRQSNGEETYLDKKIGRCVYRRKL